MEDLKFLKGLARIEIARITLRKAKSINIWWGYDTEAKLIEDHCASLQSLKAQIETYGNSIETRGYGEVWQSTTPDCRSLCAVTQDE